MSVDNEAAAPAPGPAPRGVGRPSSSRRKRQKGKARRRARRLPRLAPGSLHPRTALWVAAGLAVASALLVVLAGRTGKMALLVLQLSFLFAYMVGPAARRLRLAALERHHHLSPTAALAGVYAALAVISLAVWGTLGTAFKQESARFVDNVPVQVTAAINQTSTLARWHDFLGLPPIPATSTLGAFTLSLSDWLRGHVATALLEAVEYRWVLPWLTLVPAIAFLLMTQFPVFRRSTLRGLPQGHARWRGNELLTQVNGVLAGYARAQVFSCLIVGAIAAAGLALIRVPYPLLVGLAAGLFEFVPVVGPIAAALLVVGLVRGTHLVVALAFLLGLRLLQDLVIYPRLMGRHTHLHPALVLLSVWIGAVLGGIVGVLAAVPVAGVLAVAIRQWRDYRALEELVRREGR